MSILGKNLSIPDRRQFFLQMAKSNREQALLFKKVGSEAKEKESWLNVIYFATLSINCGNEMITIKKNPKKYNEFTLTFTGTEGKMLAVKHALQDSLSEVGKDFLDELDLAASKVPELKDSDAWEPIQR